MKQLQALLFLAWNLIALIVEKLMGIFQKRSTDKDIFLNNFKSDGLWSISESLRDEIYQFSGCTQCGLCDSTLAKQFIKETSSPGLVLPQEVLLGMSRHLPTIQFTRKSFAPYEEVLWQLEAECPAKIPFVRIFQMAKENNQH